MVDCTSTENGDYKGYVVTWRKCMWNNGNQEKSKFQNYTNAMIKPILNYVSMEQNK